MLRRRAPAGCNLCPERLVALALCGADAPTAPAWHVAALRLQIVLVYAYAGVAKLNSDWLLHDQPMATKLVDEAAVYSPYLAPLLTHELEEMRVRREVVKALGRFPETLRKYAGALAALLHDYRHRGVANRGLVDAHDPLGAPPAF